MTSPTATPAAKSRHVTWGTAMTLVFVFWVLFIAQFIYRANMLDRELVADKPYEQGLAYQFQITALRNAAPYASGIHITTEGSALRLQLPEHLVPIMAHAQLHLLRPDRRAADQHIPLPQPQSQINLPLMQLRRGHWRLRLSWTAKGQPCLYETSVFVP